MVEFGYMKPMNKRLIAPALLALIVVISLVCFVFLNKTTTTTSGTGLESATAQPETTTLATDDTSIKIASGDELVTKSENMNEVELLPTTIPSEAYDIHMYQKEIYDCQPELFDPATAEYRKYDTGGTPKWHYKIDGFEEPGGMMIDGWNEEGGRKVVLNSPYSMTVYNFGCASTMSSVVEIKKRR